MENSPTSSPKDLQGNNPSASPVPFTPATTPAEPNASTSQHAEDNAPSMLGKRVSCYCNAKKLREYHVLLIIFTPICH